MSRKAYPSDVDDETYAFMLPYLLLAPEQAPQRTHALREVLNAILWIARTGSQWAYLPHDFPPYKLVHQQALRWFERGCFETMAHDLRGLNREEALRDAVPSVAIIDSRTLQSTPESGGRAGYDGGKRKKGSKVHLAVDTFGHALTLLVTPADQQDRAQVDDLCRQLQDVTDGAIDVVLADQGYTGEQAECDAAINEIELVVIKRPHGTTGCIALPKRWIVERSFAWTARFRRLARDLERLPATLVGFHWLAFAVLFSAKLNPILGSLS